MNWLTIVLRLVHVLGGVLWVGFTVFAAFYLLPSLAETGPDGGKVTAVLQRRRLLTVFPIIALLTVLSGLWLYVRATRMAPGFSSSHMGITLGFGGVCALLALFIGMLVISPSMKRAASTAQQAAQAQAHDERQALLGLSAQLRGRAAAAARIASLLLIVAAGAMAIGRYV
ncbi:MAG TPA: hypothetical protein VGR59_05735 [Gemmatimonadaceae bacterium]|nr:hypothetical protein [Gemmatimonadaceae bacterium]